MHYQDDVVLRPIVDRKPRIAVVLGSGLNQFENELMNKHVVPFCDISHMPIATAPGHRGAFVIGEYSGVNILLMQGRLHHYEGHSFEDVVYPIRLMAQLGISYLILTNASGGINLSYSPGDLMLIQDHINFIGANPLVGPKKADELRFPDMTYAYDPKLSALMEKVAENSDILLRKGIYLATSGPSYETPAEIRAFRMMGADAVGMSTVPESIVANALRMRVVGVSCITNMAAGILDKRLTEEEVLETGAKSARTFNMLIGSFIKAMEGQL